MVTPASATLYLQKEGQTSEVATHLGGEVQMQSYDAIFDAIQGLASSSSNQVDSFSFALLFIALKEKSRSFSLHQPALWP